MHSRYEWSSVDAIFFQNVAKHDTELNFVMWSMFFDPSQKKWLRTGIPRYSSDSLSRCCLRLARRCTAMMSLRPINLHPAWVHDFVFEDESFRMVLW